MRLKAQAGWNQTEADWRRFLDLEPEGCFVAEFGGVPAATLTTCIFGPVAWIAMVLVEESVRGRGLAKALLAHALEFLEGRGVRSIRLDATALGRPLYEKLGFVVEYELARYQGVLPPYRPVTRARNSPEPLRTEELDDVVRLDRSVTGTDRGKLLRRLHADTPDAGRIIRDGAAVAGFLLGRPGSRAWQIGPCVAKADAGAVLLGDAYSRYGGQSVYFDVPAGSRAAAALTEAVSLTVQRRFVRMCRGPSVGEKIESLWASSGPEKG
jgi:hypothetical protein